MKPAIVTGCDLNYLPGVIGLLNGARRFHPDVDRYCIVPPDAADAAAAALAGLATVFPSPRPVLDLPPKLQAGLLKLFTPHVPVDVAVWIDCDVVMRGPISELWDVAAGTVNAVRDTSLNVLCNVPPPLRPVFSAQYPAVAVRQGMNGGVFGLRTSEWAALPDLYERAFRDGGYTVYPRIFDQPLLNGIFGERIRFLPFKFNAHNLFDNPVPRDVRLLHFIGPLKPWMAAYPRHEPQFRYWVENGLWAPRVDCLKARAWIAVNLPRRMAGRLYSRFRPPPDRHA